MPPQPNMIIQTDEEYRRLQAVIALNRRLLDEAEARNEAGKRNYEQLQTELLRKVREGDYARQQLELLHNAGTGRPMITGPTDAPYYPNAQLSHSGAFVSYDPQVQSHPIASSSTPSSSQVQPSHVWQQNTGQISGQSNAFQSQTTSRWPPQSSNQMHHSNARQEESTVYVPRPPPVPATTPTTTSNIPIPRPNSYPSAQQVQPHPITGSSAPPPPPIQQPTTSLDARRGQPLVSTSASGGQSSQIPTLMASHQSDTYSRSQPSGTSVSQWSSLSGALAQNAQPSQAPTVSNHSRAMEASKHPDVHIFRAASSPNHVSTSSSNHSPLVANPSQPTSTPRFPSTTAQKSNQTSSSTQQLGITNGFSMGEFVEFLKKGLHDWAKTVAPGAVSSHPRQGFKVQKGADGKLLFTFRTEPGAAVSEVSCGEDDTVLLGALIAKYAKPNLVGRQPPTDVRQADLTSPGPSSLPSHANSSLDQTRAHPPSQAGEPLAHPNTVSAIQPLRAARQIPETSNQNLSFISRRMEEKIWKETPGVPGTAAPPHPLTKSTIPGNTNAPLESEIIAIDSPSIQQERDQLLSTNAMSTPLTPRRLARDADKSHLASDILRVLGVPATSSVKRPLPTGASDVLEEGPALKKRLIGSSAGAPTFSQFVSIPPSFVFKQYLPQATSQVKTNDGPPPSGPLESNPYRSLLGTSEPLKNQQHPENAKLTSVDTSFSTPQLATSSASSTPTPVVSSLPDGSKSHASPLTAITPSSSHSLREVISIPSSPEPPPIQESPRSTPSIRRTTPLFLPSPSRSRSGDSKLVEEPSRSASVRSEVGTPDSTSSSMVVVKEVMPARKNRAYVLIPSAPPHVKRFKAWEARHQTERNIREHPDSRASAEGDSDVNLVVEQVFHDDAERDAVKLSQSRLIKRACKWTSCGLVLNACDALVEHLKTHCRAMGSKSYLTCRWHQCGTSHFTREALWTHLQAHAFTPVHCGYADCTEHFRHPRHLVKHHRSQHSNDAPKPSWRPFPPHLERLLPTEVPDTLPSYMVEPCYVQRATLSKERHMAVGSWVYRNIFGPSDVNSRRYNAAVPLRNARQNMDQGSSVQHRKEAHQYEYLTTLSKQHSSMPSEPSRIRGVRDLTSCEVSQLVNKGLVLWHVPENDVEVQVKEEEMTEMDDGGRLHQEMSSDEEIVANLLTDT